MKKISISFVIDTVAFVGFVFLASTGIIMHFLLPPGSGHWQHIWGMSRHDWGNIHFWIATSLVAVLAIHLTLHWKWIISVIKGEFEEYSRKRLVTATIVLTVIIAIAIAPLVSSIEKYGDADKQGKRHHRMHHRN